MISLGHELLERSHKDNFVLLGLETSHHGADFDELEVAEPVDADDDIKTVQDLGVSLMRGGDLLP